MAAQAAQMPPELASQINQIIEERVAENFKERDQLLLDLVQGLDSLNNLAEGNPPSPKTSYPKRLVQKTSDAAGRRKLEELLDTPHAVHAIRGGWWNIDLRRHKGELKLYQERNVAKGSACIGTGKPIKKSREGAALKYNRKYHRDIPMSATGEEGKHVCDIRMSLDTFCRIFHTECPEFNLIDAYQRGRVTATLFGEGGMTANHVIVHFENYFLKKVRGGELDAIIDTRILRRGEKVTVSTAEDGNAVRRAISDIFHQIIGTKLENVGFWTIVTERVRCKVQFEIKNFTELRDRRKLQVSNVGEISRIRQFRRTGKGVLGIAMDDIMNPKEIPRYLVKREVDMEEIIAYNTSLKGRRRRRAKDEQSAKLRNMSAKTAGRPLEKIEEQSWAVLIGFDEERKKEVVEGLQKFTRMSKEDILWALKWGVPYHLLNPDAPDMSISIGEKLKSDLEGTGCVILLERQGRH